MSDPDARASESPSAEDQLKLLGDVQRILSEGAFVATYKYALLIALADLAVLYGADDGARLTLPTYAIAERFIALYWRQASPFPSTDGAAAVLAQNTGRQAAVVRLIQDAGGGSLWSLKRDAARWHRLTKRVERVVREQPLWKLQRVGGGVLDVLYAQPDAPRGASVTLHPGVGYTLRRFHGLIVDMVQGAWLRRVRRLNLARLGQHVELADFMFGADRQHLGAYARVLREVQRDVCFYCQRPLRSRSKPPQVDHFIPWSLYPVDLGHNFVLAHAACNNHKSDRLAAVVHLDRWRSRNADHGALLQARYDALGLAHDLPTSQRVAAWAYGRVQRAGGLVWERGANGLVALEQGWRVA